MMQKIQSDNGVKKDGDRRQETTGGETKDNFNLARPDPIGKTIIIARFIEGHKMLRIMGLATRVKLQWADGMIGAIPVFDSMAAALKYENNPDVWEERIGYKLPKNDAKKVAEEILDKKAAELDKTLGGDATRKPQKRNEKKSKAGKAGKTKSNKTFTENGARRRKS